MENTNESLTSICEMMIDEFNYVRSNAANPEMGKNCEYYASYAKERVDKPKDISKRTYQIGINLLWLGCYASRLLSECDDILMKRRLSEICKSVMESYADIKSLY